MVDEIEFKCIEEHLEAMRDQLETHLALAQNAIQQTLKLQAVRTAARSAISPANETPPSTITTTSPSSSPAANYQTVNDMIGGKRMAASRSFWSFTPSDVKAKERQKRIEEGRARNWQRKRFDPERYIKLAEQALAEL